MRLQWTYPTSGFFTEDLNPAKTIDVAAHSASVAGRTFAPISMKDALAALVRIAHHPRDDDG